MFKKTQKKVIDEYFVNDTYIKKMYNLYLHQSIFNKILDISILFAIIFTLMSLILEFLIHVDESILRIIHSLSTLILIIFILELLRSYAQSKSNRKFLKKHWIDLILVSILSLYFLFVTYFGFARTLQEISKLKGVTEEFKHFKIVGEYFKDLFKKIF